MLCERWTNQLSVTLDGYEHVAVHGTKHPRARRDSGGLVFYYKTVMAQHLSILKTTGDCLLWVKLSKTNIAKDLYFCIFYEAPVDSSSILFYLAFDQYIYIFKNRYKKNIHIVS